MAEHPSTAELFAIESYAGGRQVRITYYASLAARNIPDLATLLREQPSEEEPHYINSQESKVFLTTSPERKEWNISRPFTSSELELFAKEMSKD